MNQKRKRGIFLNRSIFRKVAVFAAAILLPLAVGGLSALISASGMESYESLARPPFAPPAILFPIVWTVLYILMGISSAFVYESDSPVKRESLTVYLLQLTVNGLWSPIFFLWNARLIAFFWLLLLIAFICLMIYLFSKGSRIAAYLQIPYLIWCLFASVLNFSVWYLNK